MLFVALGYSIKRQNAVQCSNSSKNRGQISTNPFTGKGWARDTYGQSTGYLRCTYGFIAKTDNLLDKSLGNNTYETRSYGPQKSNVQHPAKVFKEHTILYSRHIFADEMAYNLFSLLMRHFKTSAAISFIFRKMAEKEKPPLILVNDTPFRKWFNEQGYEIQLENHTKTYENAKNEDRLAAYGAAKELTMSN